MKPGENREETEPVEDYRKFLKSDRWEEWRKIKTDQRKGVPAPPAQKPYPKGAKLIPLVSPEDLTVGGMPLIEAIKRRRSRRRFAEEPLTLEELSFLLWATQGITTRELHVARANEFRQVLPKAASAFPRATFRTVPSGGARHPFETYLLINRVSKLKPGLYRYLPLENKLCFLYADAGLLEKVHEACYEQYVKDSAVTFIWTVIPYRTEWRYSMLSPKLIAQDSGHLCQNLYLACEAIGAGTCAVGAYDQEKMDRVLKVDGKEEFAVYVAPVGKPISNPDLSAPKKGGR
jgi:SagB-type dehydrogenase family enzyme